MSMQSSIIASSSVAMRAHASKRRLPSLKEQRFGLGFFPLETVHARITPQACHAAAAGPWRPLSDRI